MSDLIDRQAAMKELGKFRKRPTTSTEKQIAIDYCVGILQNLPTAEKRGRWIERQVITEDDDAKIEEWQSARCSICNLYHTTPYMYYFSHYNYCPNCGADMREGDRE